MKFSKHQNKDPIIQRKVKESTELIEILAKARQQNKKVVFTNGCFDLLHIGHTRYLNQAKELGDILVVALNSDLSVQKIKGHSKPIIPQAQRAEIVANLVAVDYVVIFDEDTPLEIIKKLQPDVLVKGGDWGLNDIVGRKEVEESGGSVCSLPLQADFSSSAIIETIRSKFGSLSNQT